MKIAVLCVCLSRVDEVVRMMWLDFLRHLNKGNEVIEK